MAHRYLYLETSRGCPYHCAYCLSSADNRVRMFSEAYVLRQLAPLAERTVKQVKFLDRDVQRDARAGAADRTVY